MRDRDYTWTVGLRNSHDKSITAGLVAGAKVMVCDNLSFCGEVKISRKHTHFAACDLHHLTARAVGQLGDRFYKIDVRIDSYRSRRISAQEAHDLLIKAIDCRVITPTQRACCMNGGSRSTRNSVPGMRGHCSMLQRKS